MSILIKGMEMPDNCEECRFDTECGFCSAMPDNFCGDTDGFTKPDWCPLVEVPTPHGDLIDRDALEADILPEWNGLYVPDNAYSEKLICNAQIVIEAERTE